MIEPYYTEPGVTLYHGDCREILPHLPRFDAIVTDPPYGLGDLLDVGKRNYNKDHEWSKLYGSGPPSWDREAPEIVAHFPGMADHVIIWGGNYFVLPPSRGWLVWDKVVREFTSGHCELAWTTLDQPVRAFNFTNGELATEGKGHPTQKPLALMRWCIRFLPAGCTILDPFMGSGTTIEAARTEGHSVVGIELNQDYCDMAVGRLSQTLFDI